MYADLAVALRERGHDVRFQFNGGYDLPTCLAFVEEHHFAVADESWVPDVMFVADFRCYTAPPGVTVIDIGHGIGSKDSYYLPETQYQSDIVCFPSEYLAAKFRGTRSARFVGVGMPKLDRAARERENRAPNPKPVVLIAPTHNVEYDCLRMIRDVLQGLTDDYRVIVKPHEYHFMAPWLTDGRPWLLDPPAGVEVVRSANISSLFAIADVVVSDLSSAFMEAMGLDIPTIVCESEAMRAEKLVTPHRNEFAFQYGATVITDPACLAPAIEDILLADPKRHDRQDVARKVLDHVGTSIPAVVTIVEGCRT